MILAILVYFRFGSRFFHFKHSNCYCYPENLAALRRMSLSTATAKGKRKLKDIKNCSKDEKQPSILAYFSSPPKSSVITNGSSRLSQSESDSESQELPIPNADNTKRLKLDVESSNNACTTKNVYDDEQDNKIRVDLHTLSKDLSILDLNMGLSWFLALKDEFGKEYFQKLNDFVTGARKQGLVYPPKENVWEWTKPTRIQDVKVVILGQDPYHGPNQAHGLCFSIKKGIRNPPSLNNIYKELSKDIPDFTTPSHGHLIGWADQGVLLLNAVLTVQAGKPNSHKDKGWEQLTDAVIRWISNNLDSVVFFLWGAYAQKKGAIVDKKKHHLLQCPHPSPFSADKGFFGCGHFSKCNELLMSSGKEPIDWTRLP